MHRALTALLEHEPPQPLLEADSSVASLWRAIVALGLDNTADCATLGGFLAGSVGHAFAIGYQCALRRLLPERLPPDALAALCISEPGGRRTHPAHVATCLVPDPDAPDTWRLRGQKSFVTLGAQASHLFVLAGREGPDTPLPPRKDLRLVAVDANTPGVHREPLPPLPFVRDITHASVFFGDVLVTADDLLPGDGHAHYGRPFRTLEDAHVVCALLGRLVGLARALHWPRQHLEDILAALASMRAIALAEPDSHAVQITLAGALRTARACLEDGDDRNWADAPPRLRDTFLRDVAGLLGVANTARALRLERAWHAIDTR